MSLHKPYWTNGRAVLWQGHVLDCLAAMEAGSAHCAVTSPPYWGLRDYGLPPIEWRSVSYAPMAGLPEIEIPGCEAECGHVWGDGPPIKYSGGTDKALTGQHKDKHTHFEGTHGQYCQLCGGWRGCLGLEPTVEMFVGHIVLVARELWRVLRDDGTFWLNFGDSYARQAGNDRTKATDSGMKTGRTGKSEQLFKDGCNTPPPGLKPKDLIGIPWRVAFALQADGWWLRSDIIWAKGVSFCPTYSGSCMPESVRDRPTTGHEHVFLLSKNKSYFYDGDAVRESYVIGNGGRQRAALRGETAPRIKSEPTYSNGGTGLDHTSYNQAGRNLRTVWTINPGSYAGAHFATFPPALVEPMIKAGTSAKGCCPECGAQWERVTERNETQNNEVIKTDKAAGGVPGFAPGTSHDRVRRLDGKNYEHVRGATTGWIPTCSCDAGEPVPCTVLDPFAGTFTTGEVAIRLGRRAVGIELSKGYCDEHIIPRLDKDLQMEMTI